MPTRLPIVKPIAALVSRRRPAECGAMARGKREEGTLMKGLAYTGRARAVQHSSDARKNHAFFSNSVITVVNRSTVSVSV